MRYIPLSCRGRGAASLAMRGIVRRAMRCQRGAHLGPLHLIAFRLPALSHNALRVAAQSQDTTSCNDEIDRRRSIQREEGGIPRNPCRLPVGGSARRLRWRSNPSPETHAASTVLRPRAARLHWQGASVPEIDR